MQVIPVIDLMHGLVVRGVGGRRSEYRPIQSVLADDAQPHSLARAFHAAGFRETYVADLDAILAGGKQASPARAWNLYAQLMDCGLEPWIDAGARTADDARALARFTAENRRIGAIVAGLESLEHPDILTEMCAAVGPERLIFSLDLKAGVPLTEAAAWKDLRAEEIAAVALRAGVRRMIVLDLAKVGMEGGVGTEPLCRTLRCLDPKLQIIAGGGVRSAADLRSLELAGCDAALVASALHDGRLSPDDCFAPG